MGTLTDLREQNLSNAAASSPDAQQQTLDRYRRMVRTAPRETLERAHAQSFAELTADERRRLGRELLNAASATPALLDGSLNDEPSTLARIATRLERQQPGALERVLSNIRVLDQNLLADVSARLAERAGAEAEEAAPPSADGADFSEEFGQGPDRKGITGGSGFQNDKFDPFV